MSEEKLLLKDQYIKYLYAVENLKDKKNEKLWFEGFLGITTSEIQLVPEIDNKPAENQRKIIPLDTITNIDEKVELWWKMGLGAKKILPIHHIKDGTVTITLFSLSNEKADEIKVLLMSHLLHEFQTDFVFPFSKGGKIFLEEQPVKGFVHINDNILHLISEWLGQKKDVETINLTELNDYETNINNEKNASLILKYQKEGILISTLINAEKRFIVFLDKYIKYITGESEEDDSQVELTEQQAMLLQMMYTSDIDAAMATEMLGVSIDELKSLVNELVNCKILRVSGDEEVELTEKGTKYIVELMKRNVGA